MRSLCAKIPKKRGEFFRRIFSEAHIIDKSLIIKHNNRHLFIPLQSNPEKLFQNENYKINPDEYSLLEEEFIKYPEKIGNYKELLKIPEDLAKDLPTSFDIIGKIALIKIPKSLIEYSNIIGLSILKANKNVNTVVWDRGIKGAERIHDMEIIAGEQKTITIHKEYGIRLLMDLQKVYYSPRLSGEHYRISKLVKPGEIVLDMFAGIGPFSIMIAKYSLAKQIFSIDFNKDAIEYLIRNIDINKVTNIFPLEGDAQHLIGRVPKADRIIMNLPFGGQEYLGKAISTLKKKGIIHYHEILEIDSIDKCRAWLRLTTRGNGFKMINMSEIYLGSYSPKMAHFCFDLFLEKSS